jgi:hypothetical protein
MSALLTETRQMLSAQQNSTLCTAKGDPQLNAQVPAELSEAGQGQNIKGTVSPEMCAS